MSLNYLKLVELTPFHQEISLKTLARSSPIFCVSNDVSKMAWEQPALFSKYIFLRTVQEKLGAVRHGCVGEQLVDENITT